MLRRIKKKVQEYNIDEDEEYEMQLEKNKEAADRKIKEIEERAKPRYVSIENELQKFPGNKP